MQAQTLRLPYLLLIKSLFYPLAKSDVRILSQFWPHPALDLPLIPSSACVVTNQVWLVVTSLLIP